MRYLLSLLLFSTLAGCQYAADDTHSFNDKPRDSATWRRFYFDGFALRTPGDWIRYSYDDEGGSVSGLTNGADTLELQDFWRGAAIAGEGSPTRLFAGANIDGFPAIIAIPTVAGKGDCELQLYRSDYYVFRLNGHVRNTRTALNIFRTVTFDDGHPALTDPLSMDRFSHLYQKSAYVLFDERCKSCHNRIWFRLGPPMGPDFLNARCNDWIYKFSTG